MPDSIGPDSSVAPAPATPVSANNPCPFLRALVAAGFVDGHAVPLSRLSGTIEAASGEKGRKAKLVGLKAYLVALVANGLWPWRVLRNWWSGVRLDELRDGLLDKRGSGSRILDRTAEVNEAELARLAEFGKDRPNPAGGSERGLTAQEITAYMDANFERAKGARRRIDRKFMNAEFPVLLKVMGKGEGEERYLSVAEVRTLFVERRLPDRVAARLMLHAQSSAPTGRGLRKLAKAAIVLLALFGAAIVAIAEFPDQVGKISRRARGPAAAALAGPRSDQSRALARPGLVDGGQALVSSCKPGHRDVSGALCLVRRAGTVGHSFVHPARPAERQRLP